MLTRPTHFASAHPHQRGYTTCGRVLRRVDTSVNLHHVSCGRCVSSELARRAAQEEAPCSTASDTP